jgi:hypothetical protein
MGGRKRKLTREQEKEFIVWYRGIRSMKQKAAQLGVTDNTLRNILFRHGIGSGDGTKWKINQSMIRTRQS